MQKKVTIYDVAKAAGCSTATVSLALNQGDAVKKETRDTVMKICKELKYKPNYFGRGLSTQKTNTSGLIIPSMKNPIDKMVDGVESCLNQNGYNMILKTANLDERHEIECLEMLYANEVDGIIIFPTYEKRILEVVSSHETSNKPVVFCGVNSSDEKISSVNCDSRIGANLAVEFFINNNKKRIAFISPLANPHKITERLQGYKDALFMYSRPFDEKLILCCDDAFHTIYESTKEFVKREKPDSIFCLYDTAAIPIMRAIKDIGLRIPEDISVIGYDNIDITPYLTISLSTIETHSNNTGRLAAEILIDKLKNKNAETRKIVLQPQLILRETT